MREFIKKLQETGKGSMRLITDKELFELTEFVENKGYRLISDGGGLKLIEEDVPHVIDVPLTENDALKVFQAIKPVTYTRKTPLEQRFEK